MPLNRTASAWDLVAAGAADDRACLLDPDGRSLTRAELHRDALALAGRLVAAGIGPGTVVAWQLPSWVSAHLLTAALSRIGAVQVPVLPVLRHREVSFITAQTAAEVLVVPASWRGFDHAAMAADLGVRVVLADPEGLDLLPDQAELPAAPAGDEDRWRFYTSGTTADPKGARHTDAHLLHAAGAMVARLGIGQDDRLGLPSPLTHVGGIIGFQAGLLTGARMLLEPAFDPERTHRFFARERATLVGIGTPFFQSYLAQPDAAFPDVRAFLSGGAPKPLSLSETMRQRFGAPIVSGYGMTECPMLAWAAPDDPADVLAACEGRPVDGVEVVLRDGELCVRGPQLMLGYVDPALDATAFTDDGFLRTGDLAEADDAGNLAITGRVKDIIIRNMENVSARELEDLLHTHPAVREVAVIGLPDDTVGERICAVVAGDPTLEELTSFLREKGLSTRKLPEQLELVDALPRNAMGKVLKNELRDTLQGATA